MRCAMVCSWRWPVNRCQISANCSHTGTGPWTRCFTAGPGETVLVDYDVTLSADARPGSQWWALAKVMYFGRTRYSASAQIGVRSRAL